MVLAPRPVAWVTWGELGMAEVRFVPDPGCCWVLTLRILGWGDRGKEIDVLLWSGVRLLLLLSAARVAWCNRGGGCTDLALDAREPVRLRVVSPPSRDPPSMDDRLEPGMPDLSESDATLGRRLCAGRFSPSYSYTPGPTDFLGGFAILLFDTGG